MPPKKVNHQKKALQWVNTVKQMGRQILGQKASRALGDKVVGAVSAIPSFKKGGKVKKTGLAHLHKGEVVLNKKTTCALKHLLK